MRRMWRTARPDEDESIVEMCLELNREDPGDEPVHPEQVRRTLATLRKEPYRGRAVVLDIDSKPGGYALLISFWSNEIGGELCEIDELFVAKEHRGKGHGSSIFEKIASGELWGKKPIAMSLGTMPNNSRARRLYESLGFSAMGISMVRRLVQ
jgi:GNAT superfamily N-acetyltransferase